jgi:hypothetical protein
VIHKIIFLKEKFVPLLRSIPSDRPPAWGKMTLQQMVEHFSEAVRIGSGKAGPQQLHTPEEHVPKMQAFIESDKPFRENTRNPLMPEVPAPVRHKNSSAALEALQQDINEFFNVFTNNEHHTTLNPIFGDLNYQQNIQLLYKHAVHHLRQFGVSEG